MIGAGFFGPDHGQATAGSLAGALVLYWLGAAWGLERICALADRIPLMHAHDVRRAVAWFGRHGRTAVFVGRLVPGVRSLISIPAGIDRMPLAKFVGYTSAGSLIWNSLFVWIGFQLGDRYELVERYMDPISKVVYALIVLTALGVLVWMVRRSLRRSHDPDDHIELEKR